VRCKGAASYDGEFVGEVWEHISLAARVAFLVALKRHLLQFPLQIFTHQAL